MCDFSEKLVAWMDYELTEQEAAEMAQHVETCAECRTCLAAYTQVDRAFKAYCHAASHQEKRRSVPVWVPAVSVAAAAAAIVLLLVYPRNPVERRPSETQPAAAYHHAVLEAPLKGPLETPLRSMPAPLGPASLGRPVRQSHSPATPQSRNANWMPAEPAIQIAIPAEAMFAPGAVPQGVSFAAELRLAADGSAQQLRLQP